MACPWTGYLRLSTEVAYSLYKYELATHIKLQFYVWKILSVQSDHETKLAAMQQLKQKSIVDLGALSQQLDTTLINLAELQAQCDDTEKFLAEYADMVEAEQTRLQGVARDEAKREAEGPKWAKFARLAACVCQYTPVGQPYATGAGYGPFPLSSRYAHCF